MTTTQWKNKCNICPNGYSNWPDQLYDIIKQIESLGLGIDASSMLTQALCEGCELLQE